jgi:mono/diheme cytochrome c family protein
MNRVVPVCLFLVVAIAACERGQNDYAGISAKSEDAPQYAAMENVSGMSDVALVREVLPQGDEGYNGEALFNANCSACHQKTGMGIPGVFPPLNASPYVTGDNIERMASIILYGLQGKVHVLGTEYNNVMIGLGGSMNDDQLSAVATYIRSAWTNKAGAVSSDVFKAMRTKWGTRGAFAISELGEEK